MTKRILYFDLLTIVSCFAVVCLHCNGLVHTFQPTIAWNEALVVEVIAFWAVPIFFMLTGANNMGYRSKYDTKTFLKRRLKKLLIPFIAWSIIVYVLGCVLLPLHNSAPIEASVGDFVFSFFEGSIEPIYWFFPAIISLTLAMPVLSLLTCHRETMWYTVLLSFLLVSVAPYAFDIIGIPWTEAYSLPVAGGYVAYAIFGYLLATGEVEKKHRIAIYIGAVLCLLLRYSFTFYFSYQTGEVDRTLFDYFAFTAVFPAAAVFLLLKHHDWSALEGRQKAISTISGLSFGVYLIHMIILNYLFLGLLDCTSDTLFVRVVCPFLVYFIAIATVYLIKKIPLVKNIVP